MRVVVIGALVAGCGSPRVTAPPKRPQPVIAPIAVEALPPVLAIDAPARGTFADGGMVIVRGRVATAMPTLPGAAQLRVTVDGAPAALAADGSFAAVLALPPGLAIIETHAFDAAAHDTRDVRAVMVGPFATSDGRTRAPVAVRLGRAGIAALGKPLARAASAIDFTAAARAANPVIDVGDCMGVRADIASVGVGAIDVALAPAAGAIDTAISLAGVVVKLAVHYTVACIDGDTTVTVRTNARFRGALDARLAGGQIHAALVGSAIDLDQFDVDIGGLPRAVEKIVRGPLRVGVESALAKAIATHVPPLVDARLAALLAHPATSALAGTALTFDVAPRGVAITADAIEVAAAVAVTALRGEHGRYVASDAGGDRARLGPNGSVIAGGSPSAGAIAGWSANGGGGANRGGANSGGANRGGANSGGANRGGANSGGANSGGAKGGGAKGGADAGAPAADLRVTIAADVIAQPLAGLWAAHAFDRTVAVADLGAAAMLLPPGTTAIAIELPLPPTVTAGDYPGIAVGDVLLTLRDAQGRDLQRLAVSLRATLAVDGDALVLADPDVRIQVLAGDLDGAALEGLFETVWPMIAKKLAAAIALSPPGSGLVLTPRAIRTHDRAIVLDLAITAP